MSSFDEHNAKTAQPEGTVRGSRIREWTPSRRASTHAQLESAGSYSRFVDVMKLFLPISALGLFILLITYSALNDTGNFTITVENLPTLDDDLFMAGPKLSGFDAKNRPFEVVARKAVQDLKDPNLVDMESVTGDLFMPAKDTLDNKPDRIRITADKGFLNSNIEELALNGNVILVSTSNYRFETETAIVEFGKSRVSGDTQITGESNLGRVIADTFEVWDGGNMVRFEGNVKTTIFPGGKTKDLRK